MFCNLTKKFTPIVLTLSLLAIPSLVSAEKVSETKTKQEKREKLNEKLDYLKEQLKKTKDFEKSLEATSKKYKSLKVIDSAKKNSNLIPQSTYNEVSWLDLDDSLVYDDEIEEYVFIGYWEWDEDEGFIGDKPYDFVGVISEKPSDMSIDEDGVVLQGWNGLGDEEAFFDTSCECEDGRVQLEADKGRGGVGFWIDDRYVTNGMITAIMDKVSTDKDERVKLQYDHSWTDTSITSIGGNASLGAGGFSISWKTEVEHFPTLTSRGEYWN